MDTRKFQTLSAENRALVAVAVLLDGHEAANFLSTDSSNGSILKEVAVELSGMAPDLRMPLLGTLLRTALAEIKD